MTTRRGAALDTERTLLEARVLYELGQRPRTARADLRTRMAIDESFLTRVVGRLERSDWSPPSAIPMTAGGWT